MQVQRQLITTITGAAASHDLTDLETVKDELNIPDGDTTKDVWLSRGITQISRAIEKFCERPFVPEFLTDAFYAGTDVEAWEFRDRLYPLILARKPVIAIASVTLLPPNEPPKLLVAGVDFAVNEKKGWLLRLSTVPGVTRRWEPVPVIVTYCAGYGSQLTQNTTIPASPYQITVDESDDYACDCGILYADGTPFVPVQGNPAKGQYTVDTSEGLYTFSADDLGQSVNISYAASAIPDDLVDATLRLVTQRFKQKDRDPMLMSQNQGALGERRWWVGSPPGQNGAFPPEILGLLEPYRVPVIA